ncbi:hypothetical protein J5N97_025105 [Dioscorea zingiberensis]|uniref:Cytochrome P450 n=1 Tax=Dioscorea zingiberensis TaxID=325984 RepID=A0A9D5C8H1_9LILI|nr:hypothetical protein J5N97_025105 [Dioscorea zingiberensis]
MDLFFLLFILVTISIALLLKQRGTRRRLPPSPPTIPILGNLLWLTKPFSQMEPMLHRLRAKYGPVFTLYVGSRPVVFIMDGKHVHRSLIANSEAFAHRPLPLTTSVLINSNLRSINNTPYGSLWRILRRNIASEVIHPSKASMSSTHVQRMALDILLKSLRKEAEANGGVVVPVHSIELCIAFLMSSLCFGVTLDEQVVDRIKNVQHELLSIVHIHFALNLLPKVALLLSWRRLGKLKQLRRAQDELFIPLIRARKELLAVQQSEQKDLMMISYVDSLLKLRVEDGAVGNTRALREEEIVSFCSEFLDASIWSSSKVLEWITARMVKHQDIQEKLKKEIRGVMGDKKRLVDLDELQRMPYVKAVIFEALRRHPPAHFLIPHAVKEDVMMDEYLIPNGSVVNFMVTSIGLDGRTWEEPLEFRPERFMPGGEGEEVDVTCGKREIKMMPFGAGRRMCPGLDMAVLQIQYLLVNLINEIDLKAVDGLEVDFSDDAEIFVSMKNPCHARIAVSPA